MSWTQETTIRSILHIESFTQQAHSIDSHAVHVYVVCTCGVDAMGAIVRETLGT